MTMTRLEVTLVGSGASCGLETDGVNVVLRLGTSSPPGSTLAFSIPGVAAPYRVKVRGCRKLESESARPFRIEGRFFDLTRLQIAALTSGSS